MRFDENQTDFRPMLLLPNDAAIVDMQWLPRFTAEGSEICL
jgi:hypothetical protein